MAKINGVRMTLWLLVSMMLGSVRVSSDFAEDNKECQDQLIHLSSCVRFISEEDKSPSPICCINLGENYDQKRKCMCTLVRDRNETGLGFKVNATLALALPFICHIQANVTRCIDFLHLDPQSPDAQIFKQSYDNIFGSNNSISSSDNSSDSRTSPNSSSGVRGKRWLNLGMVGGISVWLLTSSLICFT